MAKDLDSTLRLLHAGGTTAMAEMARGIQRALTPECQHVFTPLLPEQAAREATNPGQAHRPLAGLAVSVKDLFDMQGMPTPAGSRVLAEARPPATARAETTSGPTGSYTLALPAGVYDLAVDGTCYGGSTVVVEVLRAQATTIPEVVLSRTPCTYLPVAMH